MAYCCPQPRERLAFGQISCVRIVRARGRWARPQLGGSIFLPLNENLLGCQGKSLTDLRNEIVEMASRLRHLRSGAGMFGWAYF